MLKLNCLHLDYLEQCNAWPGSEAVGNQAEMGISPRGTSVSTFSGAFETWTVLAEISKALWCLALLESLGQAEGFAVFSLRPFQKQICE